jgi:ABC-2 type transport system ATP-binding protein
MVDGNLVALDTPAALKRAWVPGLLWVVRGRELAAGAEALRRLPGITTVAPFGAGLHVRAEPGRAGAEEVLRALAAAGATAVSVERSEPSLEDVFLAAVERGAGGAPAARPERHGEGA